MSKTAVSCGTTVLWLPPSARRGRQSAGQGAREGRRLPARVGSSGGHFSGELSAAGARPSRERAALVVHELRIALNVSLDEVLGLLPETWHATRNAERRDGADEALGERVRL